MAHELYQDVGSNMAGFEWVWTFSIDQTPKGFELIVNRTDNDRPRRPYVLTRGRISTGAELLEEIRDVCSNEDIDIGAEDFAAIGERLMAFNESLAAEFIRALADEAR
jgi:hypothetical protein